MTSHRTLVFALLASVALAAGAEAGQATDEQAGAAGGAQPADQVKAKSDGVSQPVAGSTGAKAPSAPSAAKPAPATGLERLSDDWPKWLKVGVLHRGRIETNRAPTVAAGDYDRYYLNRLRLSASTQVGSFLQMSMQVQDAQVLGYAVTPAPKSVANALDLRTAWVEIGRKGTRGATASIGRQELTFGDGRLLASPDWGNVSRTYDLVRVAGFMPGLKVDGFYGAPVDVNPSGFHTAKQGERFYGAYATLDKVPHLTLVDAYAISKDNAIVTGETGSQGDGRIVTSGFLVTGKIGKRISWDAENGLQRGHQAADVISAWATHEAIGYLLSTTPTMPRVTFEYDFASGDASATDNVRGTFDQLYASNHAKYGLADQVGWRNLRAVIVRFDVSPSKKFTVNAALSHFSLATTNDAWYGSSGSKVVLNRKATSRDLGWETDGFVSYAVSKELTLGAGLGVLFAGDFILQSTGVQHILTPYLTWNVKF